MKKSYLTLLITLIALGACTSTRWVSPPQEGYVKEISIHNKEQVERNDLTESEKLASSFIKANLFSQEGNKYHSCTRYKYLSNYDNFPLKDLARVRALRDCAHSNLFIKTEIKNLLETSPKWLNEELAHTVLDTALKYKLSEETAIAARMLSSIKKTKNDKEHYIDIAQTYAKASKNQTLFQEITQEKEKLAPRMKSKVTKEDWFEVAKDFEKIRQFDSARSYYWKIIHDNSFTPEQRFQSFEKWKLTYKLSRDHVEFIKKSTYMLSTLNKWRKKNPNEWTGYFFDTAIAHARAIWTRNNRSEGEKVLKNILKENGLSPDQKAMAYFVLGSMELEKNRLNLALEHFSEVADLEIKDKDVKNNILWNVGWTLYQLKNYKMAAEKFALYNKTNEDYFFKLKSLFWWAKSVQRQGDLKNAERLFEDVIEQDPFGYYGLISHVESKNALSPLKDNGDEGTADETLEWLITVGERELARSYLDELFSKTNDYSQVKELLPLYRRARHYDGGMTQFFKVPPEKRNSYLEDHIATAYPVAYTSEIGVHCKERFGLDPALVKAIIRQESAFNTYIRSWADAFGLMQLIPEKAKVLAKKLKVPYRNFQDLYDPNINLPLGCALLKEHLSDYDNNIIITAASYNAGENVVKNWLKTRFDGDYVEFIESIPYEETRNYVKLILRNIMVYKRISIEKPFTLNFNDLFHSN